MMKRFAFFKENNFSLASLLLVLLTIIVCLFIKPSVDVIKWDVFGYYLYLPAFFIHNDIGLNNIEWVYDIVDLYHNTDTLYQFAPSPLGHMVNQYSMGMAFLYFPFFVIGHIIALFTSYAVDGYSFPYQVMMFVSGLFYFILGLIYLRKVLLHFFSDKVSAIVILLIGLGTNYFQIELQNGLMPHSFLFALYALLVWVTIKWEKEITVKNSIFLGLLIGLITLARPTEIVCVFIPLLYGVTSVKELLIRKSLLYEKWKYSLTTILVSFFVGLPQLIYWKALSGRFIYYSYVNKGEGLDLLSPNFINVLFSFRKGWLVYAPMMIFSIIGLYFIYKNYRKLFLSITVFFGLNLYLISAWSNWWYADSFGQRSLMQSYMIMAIPLGALVASSFKAQKNTKNSVWIIMGLFIVLNLFQTRQVTKQIIDGSRMTQEYYWSIFGQMSPPTTEQKELLLIERSTTSVDKFLNQENYTLSFSETLDFEESNDAHIVVENARSGTQIFRLDKAHSFSKKIKKEFNFLTQNDHAWIKISFWFYPTKQWKESKMSLIATFSHKGKDYKYRGLDTELLTNIKLNEWNKIEMDYLTPEVRSGGDVFSTYLWLRGEEKIMVDDLKIEVYNK